MKLAQNIPEMLTSTMDKFLAESELMVFLSGSQKAELGIVQRHQLHGEKGQTHSLTCCPSPSQPSPSSKTCLEYTEDPDSQLDSLLLSTVNELLATLLCCFSFPDFKTEHMTCICPEAWICHIPVYDSVLEREHRLQF